MSVLLHVVLNEHKECLLHGDDEPEIIDTIESVCPRMTGDCP